MNAEHLLDAMGLLDDDLIQEAETYQKPRLHYRPWISLAACLAIVIVLGYGLTHIGMGGGNSAAPGNSGGAASAPAGSAQISGGNLMPEAPSENESQEPAAAGGSSPDQTTDYCPAIMVDGTLYWSTGEAVPVEVEESAIRTVTSYINTVPQMDGQTNFSQDLSARYALTSEGLVVLMDQEWILFDPIPPWER